MVFQLLSMITKEITKINKFAVHSNDNCSCSIGNLKANFPSVKKSSFDEKEIAHAENFLEMETSYAHEDLLSYNQSTFILTQIFPDDAVSSVRSELAVNSCRKRKIIMGNRDKVEPK